MFTCVRCQKGVLEQYRRGPICHDCCHEVREVGLWETAIDRCAFCGADVEPLQDEDKKAYEEQTGETFNADEFVMICPACVSLMESAWEDN